MNMQDQLAPRFRDLAPSYVTPIDAPIHFDDPDTVAWDEACDTLVIGGGMAGVATALRLAELSDQSVILADRFTGGGTSAISGGVLYLGGGTHVQEEAGVPDTPIDCGNYLVKQLAPIRDESDIRRFSDSGRKILAWLEHKGVQFGGPAFSGKAAYPPADTFLYYTGNEKCPDFTKVAAPAQRGHRAKSPDAKVRRKFAGAYLMKTLWKRVDEAKSIMAKRQTPLRRLIVDSEGSVIGAELAVISGVSAMLHSKLYHGSKSFMLSSMGYSRPVWTQIARIEAKAKTIRIRARKGVVLATGGFIHNRKMVDTLAPKYQGFVPIGSAGDDGTALRCCDGLDVKVGEIDHLSPWRTLFPPEAFCKGIMIGPAGNRIVNEESYSAVLGEAIVANGGKAWLIIDQHVLREVEEQLKAKWLWLTQRYPARGAIKNATKAATIEALSALIGVPADALVSTIERHNADIAHGRADALNKGNDYRAPLSKGPFLAIDMVFDKSNPAGTITVGGLEVDHQTNQVMRSDGCAYPGLYAVGRAAVGLVSHRLVSGMTLSDCLWSGWQAAAHLAGTEPPDAAA